MYFYNDGMCLCDGCAGDNDMLYGDWISLKEDEKDDYECEFCGGNDFKDGDK